MPLVITADFLGLKGPLAVVGVIVIGIGFFAIMAASGGEE